MDNDCSPCCSFPTVVAVAWGRPKGRFVRMYMHIKDNSCIYTYIKKGHWSWWAGVSYVINEPHTWERIPSWKFTAQLFLVPSNKNPVYFISFFIFFSPSTFLFFNSWKTRAGLTEMKGSHSRACQAMCCPSSSFSRPVQLQVLTLSVWRSTLCFQSASSCVQNLS